jgi:acetolactate synthase-1/2/3 large subunit
MPQSHAEGAVSSEERATARNVAAALKETLESLGVEYLFGMESPPALHAELGGSRLRPITIRDERSGAFMADGYAKVSGKPGVCGVSGVGSTNTVQGLIESYLSSTPVLVFSEEGSGTTRHKNDLQDLDFRPIFSPVTKWAFQLEDPARVPELVAQAFRVATTGRPGPVYVGCPWDVFSSDPIEMPALELTEAVYPAIRVAPDPRRVEDVAKRLRSSQRPVLVAGSGVLGSGAEGELLELARTLGAPVAVTPAGKGSIDEDDPVCAGVVGSYASGTGGSGVVAHEIVNAADLVVLIATGTGSGSTNNWTLPRLDQEIVHIDIDPVEIGRNYPRSVPLVGDAKLALAALLGALGGGDGAASTGSTGWANALLETAHSTPAAGDRPAATGTGRGVPPAAMYAEIQRHIDERTRIVCDAGYSTAWAVDQLRVKRGRRFLGPMGYGTMGYGLPAAIGAKLADPDSRVICISGDGGIGFSLAELETAARYGIGVTTVIFNNSGLGWSRHYNRKYYGYEGETEFSTVDYGAVARGLGCSGVHATSAAELSDALDAALGSEAPWLIDVEIDPETRPPVAMFG